MDQIDKQFVPKVLVIQKGSAVLFPNSDNIRHQVYSFSKPKVFEIKLYSGVPSKPVTFPNPGIIALGCNIHDTMSGYIFVADNAVAVLTDASGKVQIPGSVGDKLQIWHPSMLTANTTLVERVLEDDQGDLYVQLDMTPDSNSEPDQEPKTFGQRFAKNES